jgi:Recombination endonuclease VII
MGARGVKQRKWDSSRAKNLFYQYGITVAEFEELLEAQDGRCAICRELPKDPESSASRHHADRVLNVDHNHETSRVRGLLCAQCNRALGLFRDDLLLLEAAVAYMKRCDG